MPRKQKKASYKESDGSDDDNSDWEDKKESFEEEESSKPRAPKTTKPPSSKSATASDEDDDEERIPSELRKTVAGGYAHTNKSKIKISKANRGNVPWNKGKQRSALQRAKIAAGVRARNREALLNKLTALGLTEEEYEAKQKKVSYLRDKLWKAKKQNKEKAEKFAEQLKKLKSGEIIQEQQQKQAKRQQVIQLRGDSSDDDDDDDDNESDDEESDAGEDKDKNDDKLHPVLAVFTHDIHWTPHNFDPPPKHLKKRIVRYNEICPNGGPGGLICCSTCAATYSRYISSTLKSMTVQRTSKMAAETQELLGMLDSAKTRLAESVKSARKKPPPVPSSSTI